MRRSVWAYVLGALLTPVAAFAAGPTSCPPLGSLPGYKPDPAVLQDWEGQTFERKAAGSDDTEEVVIQGPHCTVHYAIEDGRDPMSTLEIHNNYRLQIQQMGGEILTDGGRTLYARLVKGGAETWMSVYSEESSIELNVVQKQPVRITLLPPGNGDYRLLGRMPNYVPDKPTGRNFDQMAFDVATDSGDSEVKAQGRTFTYHYTAKSAADSKSNDEVHANFRDALQKLGAEILLARGRNTTARLVNNGQVIWLSVYGGADSYDVSGVEEKPFEPSIKPAPDTLKSALDKAGRVALYVNFDFGKATLRPDAAPVVTQVVALLKADPALRLSVEGHTDNLGAAELNRKLSQDRAAALVAALTAQGIAANRLQAAGYGPDKPVTGNDTSEGRARNRRVELVKM